MTDHIVIEQADRVCTLRINRPEKRNALTLAMYSALADGIDAAEKNAAIRAILIRGSDQCFTAGNDLQDFLSNPPTGGTSPAMRFLQALQGAEKPIVAAVSKMAIGIGTTLLLHCDLVIAGESTSFSLPFVNLGLTPEAGSSLLLPLAMGHRRAAHLLLLGESFTATHALDVGIISEVVRDDAVMATAEARARAIAAKPPAAVRHTKKLLKEAQVGLAERMAKEGVLFAERLRSPEAQEAMHAVIEKRAPDFAKF